MARPGVIASKNGVKKRGRLHAGPRQRAAGRRTAKKSAPAPAAFATEDLGGIVDAIKEYAIVLLDPEGRFRTWSTGAQEIFGFSPAEAIGQHLRLISSPRDAKSAAAEADLAAAARHGSVREDRWHVRKEGAEFWGTGVLGALRDRAGRLTGYFHIVRDNTHRKRDEELLRQAKEEAEQANAAKDHFLANVSHELRTPLSTCLLWAKLLNNPVGVDPQLMKEGLAAIERSAREQQRLVEDLMDMSRIVNGKLRLELERLALVPLARRIVEEFQPHAQAAQVTLAADFETDDGFVIGDPRRLRQILSNLLGNALKFTPAGGRVALHLASSSDWLELRVEDNGEGIPPLLLPRIFDRFSQAELDTQRVTAGLGLGLAITRQLVELHGGGITAQSAGPGLGATFTVRLPRSVAAPSRPARSPQPKTPAARLDGVNILVVEDTEGTREALVALLDAAGATVNATADVPGGVRAYKENPPDLILSDLGLPPSTGHHLLNLVRGWERDHHRSAVPAVALSAYADEKSRRAAAESGFVLFLAKPIEPEPLIAALRTALL